MLTIGQVAAYAGVTVRAVRHYHQVGLLPEPDRDEAGYRRYGPAAVVSLIRIRILAEAGVPLSRIARMLEADTPDFAAAVHRIDSDLRAEIAKLERSRRQIAQLHDGERLALPPEVIAYLDRLREIGVSERLVSAERDAWTLLAARWPDRVAEWIPGKIALLDDPRQAAVYLILSEIFASDAGPDDQRLARAADMLAELASLAEETQAVTLPDEVARDHLPFDLLDALVLAADPRAERLTELMRERGWVGWARTERI